MPQYRFFFVKENGAPARGTAFPFHNDEHAIEFAEAASKGLPAKLWSGDRCVWRRPRENKS